MHYQIFKNGEHYRISIFRGGLLGIGFDTPMHPMSNYNKITLVEKDMILENNGDNAEMFNDFFTILVSKSNIPRYQSPFTDSWAPDSKDNLVIRKPSQYHRYY